MKKILIPLFLLIASVALGQTHYNPSKGSVVNSPVSPAQGFSTDGRSQFLFDSFPYYVYRDYKSTTEVNTYLYLSKFRMGKFSVYVHTGGTLNTNGTYTGGVTDEYWYKNGTADSNLVIKQNGGGVANLDSTRTDSTIIVNNSAGTPATFKKGDSTLGAGVVDKAGATKLQRQDIANSFAELRLLNNPVAGHVYHAIINGINRDFVWNPTCTITDDSAVVVKLASVGTGRLVQDYRDKIYVDWWNTKHNGSTDDTYYIQKAINFAVSVSTINHAANLVFGGYVYICNKAMIYKKTSAEYDFVTLNISGPAPTHDDGEALGAITVLQTNQLNGFVMGTQKGRNIKVSNITFYGTMTTLPNPAQTFTWTTAQWLNGQRNNAKSPVCLFAVDPFYVSVLTADQYPGMAAWYSNTQAGGTTQLTFDGCTTRYSNVAIAVSTNSFTQNAENIVYENGSTYGCRVFWASGQNQSRTNKIVNTLCLGATQFFIDCNNYGNNQGSPPNMYDCNLAGAVKYVYLFNGQFSGMSIFGGDMESLYSLGVSGGRPVNLTNVHITLMRPEVEGTFVSPMFAEGSVINLYGGSVEHFDGEGIDNVRFNMDQVNIYGTTFIGGPPLNAKTEKFNNVMFYGCELKTNGLSSTLNEKYQSDIANEVSFRNQQTIPGMVFRSSNGAGGIKFNYTTQGEKFQISPLGTETVKIDSTTWSGYFKTTSIGAYQQFDLLAASGIDDTTDIYSSAFTTIGYITRISDNSGTGNDTVFIKNIVAGTLNNHAYTLYVYRIPTFQNRVLGTVTSGSATITNVQYTLANLTAGAKIKGVGIPVNTYVVSNTSTTIVMSQVAVASSTTTALYDANLFMSADVGYAGVYFKNDEYKVDGGGNDTAQYKWVCTRLGYNGGTPAALFKAIAYTSDIFAGLTDYALLYPVSNAPSQNTDLKWDNTNHTLIVDGYNTTKYNLRVSDFLFQGNSINNSSIMDNVYFDGSVAYRFYKAGAGSGWAYIDGQLLSQNFAPGTAGGVALVKRPFKTDWLGHVYLGGTNINFVMGSGTGANMDVSTDTLLINGHHVFMPNIKSSASAPDSVMFVNRANGEVETRKLPSSGYTIQQIRDSLQLDTTYHARDFTFGGSAVPFNIDTVYFTNFTLGLELIRITCEMMVSKSTGESYTSTRTKWYKIINGTITDGDSTDSGNQYIPTGGTACQFFITRSGGQMLIYMIPEVGTFTGSITYQVKRKKN